MRRILLALANPFPGLHGTQVYTASMAEALLLAGHHVSLLSVGTGGGCCPEGLASWSLSAKEGAKVGPGLQRARSVVRLVAGATRFLARHPTDLVMAHHLPALMALAPACARFRVPLVYCAHTDLAEELPSWFPHLPRSIGRAGAAVEAKLLGRCQGWIATDPSLAQILDSRCRGALPGATVYPSLCQGDSVLAPYPQGPWLPWLAWSGSLDSFQGLELLARCWPMVIKQVPEARLRLLTHDVRPLPSMLRQVGVEKLKLKDWAGVMGWLSRSPIFVLPRQQEGGLAVKLLSAMALGRAIVTTPEASDGILRDRQSARLVAADPEEWARVLVALLSQPEQCRRLGQAARRLALDRHLSRHRVGVLKSLLRRVDAAG